MPEVEISAVAHGGDGIARIDGRVCFVPGALPGDVLQVEIQGQSRGVLRGSLHEVVEPGPYRQTADCPAFDTCGGCSWLHFAYPGQAEWKRNIVTETLRRIGKVETETRWIDAPALRLGYRTRAAFHGQAGQWGFYERRSHRVAPIDHCPLLHPKLNEAFARLRKISLDGTVEITVNPEGEDVLVWTEGDAGPLFPVFPNANSLLHAARRDQFLFDGVPVVNGTFSQSSLLLNRLLVRTVHEYIRDAASILDLYCGSGNLSLALARDRTVVGLDRSGPAVAAAHRTGIGEYRIGDESSLRDAIAERPWDAIILDPPRTGVRAVTKALANADTGRIVYVGCDPAATARDIGYLAAHGWNVEEAAVADLFPNTPHIETVCLCTRA